MIRSLATIWFVIFCFCSASAQHTLSGKVVDAVTHKPIPLANVFLSNTSVGTITDEGGVFTIQRFPDGRYELIVSCIGYETFNVQMQSDKLPANLPVSLKPKVTELQEVIVEPYEKDGWEKWKVFFTENFIGTSSNAADCKLLNKEVVKFRFSKKKNTLQAFADEPLIIENHALGYILKYSLTKFVYDFNTNIFFYQGYPFFTEMETTRNRIKKRWETNRKDAYHGSIMHFLRSLYRNKLVENNFEVRRLKKVPEEEKNRVKMMRQNQMKKLSFEGRNIHIDQNMGLHPDTAAYYQRVALHPEQLNVLDSNLLTGDSIAYAIDSVTVGLEFRDYLQVIYKLKKNPIEYAQKFLYRGAENAPVISELQLIGNKPITVLANGSYFEGSDLLTIQYWGWWEKLGNMLPYGYWPPKQEGSFFIKKPGSNE